MDEMREAIKKKQKQIEDLENAEGLQEEIDKLKRELISLETEHQTWGEKCCLGKRNKKSTNGQRRAGKR